MNWRFEFRILFCFGLGLVCSHISTNALVAGFLAVYLIREGVI